MNNNRFKFRVWDTLTKSFIYPDKGYQGHFIIDLNGKFHNLQNGSGGDDYIIQQFTGLFDKNGKEIYEGDIVKEHHYEDWGDEVGYDYIGVVEHIVCSDKSTNVMHSQFMTYPTLEEYHSNMGNYIRMKCEVIGNIMENPDLLK